MGDRGLLTDARPRRAATRARTRLGERPAAPGHPHLVEVGALDLTRLAETDVLECTAPTYPQERLIACRNLAGPRAGAEAEASSKRLSGSWTRLSRRPRAPHAGSRVRLLASRVAKVRNRLQMGKHFQIALTDTQLRYTRDAQRIAADAALDGVYVVRTSVSGETLSPEWTVGAYKSLAAERAFEPEDRGPHVRPIGHRLTEQRCALMSSSAC